MTGARPFGANLVAMVTPMLPDGRVDDEGVDRLVRHLLAGGCDGLVVAGTTGEAPMLDDDEWSALVTRVRTAADGRALVVAGVSGADTRSGAVRAGRARGLGADGVLVVCPYYVKPSQAGVVAHCRAVADAAGLPVMLYDVPHRAGIAMAPSTLRELAGHPGVVAVKDARGDLADAAELAASGALDVFCGSDDVALPYLAVGAAGVVSVVGNVVPDAVGRLLQAVAAGDLPAARAADTALRPLVRAVNAGSQGAVLAKEALVRVGVLEHATVRLPLVPADDAARVGVAAALARVVGLF